MSRNGKKIFSRQDRALLSELIRTDFKLRYQGSVLGYLWSLLKPLMLFAILYVVFSKFLRLGAGVPNYALSLLLGIVLWSFFVEATNSSLKSIVGKGSLIRKISIPRYLIPIAAISSAFINMALNMIVVFVFVLLGTNTALSWESIIIFPLLILELAALSVAVGFFLSAVFVRLRDIDHIWEVARQALFYLTPIIYPITLIPILTAQKLLILSPLAQIIQDARAVITYDGTPVISDLYGNVWMWFVPVGIVLTALALGVLYFVKQSKYFAENV